jgi:LysM repeat protein
MIEALLVVGLSFFNPQVPADSLGTEKVDGKLVVIHQVEEKETLYSLSRRYGTTVETILQFNPSAGSGLSIGQVLKIPYTHKSPSSASTGGIHKVAEKETLFSISRMYGVSIDEIKEWNKLTSNSLSPGQELIIKKTDTQPSVASSANVNAEMKMQKGVHQVAQKETMFSISKQYNVSIDDLKRWNNMDGNDLQIGQLIYVAQPQDNINTVQQSTPVAATIPVVKEQTTNTQSTIPVTATTTPKVSDQTASRTITISESVRDGDEVVQSGLAELIEGTDGNRKYLALHRTAPIGTILKVRNEMNNREVFVRVVGKLPDTTLTDKLIIKISKSAYDRLGAIDPRFRVEITYYK